MGTHQVVLVNCTRNKKKKKKNLTKKAKPTQNQLKHEQTKTKWRPTYF